MVYKEYFEQYIILIIHINILVCLILCVIVMNRKIPLKQYNDMISNTKKNPIFSINFSKESKNAEKIEIGKWTLTQKKGFFLNFYKHDKHETKEIKRWRNKQFYINSNKEKYTYKYLAKNSVPYNEECKEGYKKCGLLDTMNNILCLENDEECPINDLIITNKSDVPNKFLQYSNYSLLDFEDGSYLFYTNEAINSHIIVEFTLSNYKPCLDLGKCQKKYEDTAYDDRYGNLDEIDQYTFYEQNKFLGKDISFINKKGIKSVKLFTRSFIGYNLSCIDDNFFLFKNLPSSWKWGKYLMIISFIISFLTFFHYDLCFPEKAYLLDFFNFPDHSLRYTIYKVIVYSLPGIFALGAFLLVRRDVKLGCGDELIDAILTDVIKNKQIIMRLDCAIMCFHFINASFLLLSDLLYQGDKIKFFLERKLKVKKPQRRRYIEIYERVEDENACLNRQVGIPIGIILIKKKKTRAHGCSN